MAIAQNIKRFMENLGVAYEVLSHPAAQGPLEAAAAAYLKPESLVCAQVLKDRRGLLMAVFPATHVLDIEAVNRQLERDLAPAAEADLKAAFPDCDPHAIPPLAEPYGIKAIVDDSLGEPREVYFQGGSPTDLVHMPGRSLRHLLAAAWHGTRIARRDPTIQPALEGDLAAKRVRVRERVEQTESLPAMPEMAQRIMQLRANPYAGVRDLARALELDPSLAAQVIRYAQSPFFGTRIQVGSVHDAINRVLGYDMVMNVALGIAAGRSFQIPREGPLGLESFWRHATYCAALTQSLGKVLPADRQPRPGLAYLSGLLHNFGFLLLGHLFQPEFFWLNRTLAARPDAPVHQLEKEMLGVTHMELGTWLMESWRMPSEVVTAIAQHHNPDYQDLHATYANLVLLANRLLRGEGIGECISDELPPEVLERLGIGRERARLALGSVLQGSQALDGIARQMAA